MASRRDSARVDQGAALLAWLRQRCDEICELVAELVMAESPSLEPAAQARAAEIIVRELEGVGLAVERVAGDGTGDHLLAVPPGRGIAGAWAQPGPEARPGVGAKLGPGAQPDPGAHPGVGTKPGPEAQPASAIRPRPGAEPPFQLVLGHLDTVWPVGTLAEMPLRTHDGLLYGPGAFDMKAGLAQLIFALRALAALGIEPALPVVVFVNADEELGSPDSRRHIERLAREAARAFVLEPAFGAAGRLKTARKGVGRFTLRARGRASHAGLAPEAGASAILEVSHQIQRLFALNDAERGITVNVGRIDGGLRPNVIAPEARAEIEARVVTAADAQAIERSIRALEPAVDGVALEVEGGFDRPPLERTARNRELWKLAVEVAGVLGLKLGEALVGGASDGNIASAHTATLDGLGAVGDGAHAAYEHVIIDRIPERAALLASLLATPTDPREQAKR